MGGEEKLRAHIEKETGQRAVCQDGKPTFQWFWEHVYLPSRVWSPAMESTVTSVVKLHVLPKFGGTELKDLDPTALQQHLKQLAVSFSGSLVKKVLVQYRAVLELAVDEGYITKSPARKLKKPATRKSCGRFLELEEFDALMAELPFRDRLIVRMACTMGFRPGELFALRWNDIEDARVRVDESTSRWGMKEPKTEGSDAFIPMPTNVQHEMDMWRQLRTSPSPTSLVFPTANGTPTSPHNFERDVIVPAAIRAGIMMKPPKDRKKGDPKRDKATAVNFQAFRRTFATWMQKVQGTTVKDVQGAMRHASPEQTVRVYMREIPLGVRSAVDGLDLLLSKKRAPVEKTEAVLQ